MQRVNESLDQEEPERGHLKDDVQAAASLYRYALTAAKVDNDEFITEQPGDSHFLSELLEGIKRHEPSRVTIIHKKRGRKRFTTVDDEGLRGLLTRKEQRQLEAVDRLPEEDPDDIGDEFSQVNVKRCLSSLQQLIFQGQLDSRAGGGQQLLRGRRRARALGRVQSRRGRPARKLN